MNRYDYLDDADPTTANRVKHIPLAPPRPCTPGEGIYLDLWQQWATAYPGEWRGIFSHGTTAAPRQRAASVAASFMVFMGCNGGQSFTHKAETYAKSGGFFGDEAAYLAAWAVENRRSLGVNHGLRTSEYMLAAEHPIVDRPFTRGPNWKRVPVITQDDNDYIECMVVWWSTVTAREMRRLAEVARKAAVAAKLDAMRFRLDSTRAVA